MGVSDILSIRNLACLVDAMVPIIRLAAASGGLNPLYTSYHGYMLQPDAIKKAVRVIDQVAHLDLPEANLLLTSSGMDSIGTDFDGTSLWDADISVRKDYVRDCLSKKNYDKTILQNWSEVLSALDSLKEERLVATTNSEELFLFASHLTKDRVLIKMVADSLMWNWNIRLFVAHSDIRISEDWSSEIKKALSTCDAGVAFITDKKAFKESTWCDQEVGWMLGRFENRVLPLRFKLEGQYQDPYGPLGGRQAETVGESETTDQIATAIVDWCMSREQLHTKLATSLAKTFANARGWYQRDDVYRRMKSFDSLNEMQVGTILKGMRDNSQTWGGEDRTTAKNPSMLDSLLDFIVAQSGFDNEENHSLLKAAAEKYDFIDDVKKRIDLWPNSAWDSSEEILF